MARIRTIKPQFWENEELSEVSESACLLAIALLNYSDDEGYFNANEKLVKAACFPIRDISTTIRRMFDELSNIGYLEFSKDENNRIYGRVVNFLKHQRIDRPQKSKISDLELVWFKNLQFDDNSTNIQRTFAVGIRNKERNKEEVKVIDDFDFDFFWNDYDKKIGLEKCKKKWISLKQEERDLIFLHIPKYKESQPDKQFRQNPETYLNNKSWNDEIIKKQTPAQVNVQTHKIGPAEHAYRTNLEAQQIIEDFYKNNQDEQYPTY